MSRRREAADLARALLLSTQEASTVAQLSPHTLTSSKSGTPDSKEMELHALLHPQPSAPSASIPPSIPSSSAWGQPPAVRTFTQDLSDVTGLAQLPTPSDTSDPIVTALTPSFGVPSAIASFTPSKTISTPPSISPLVAGTNSSSPRPANAPGLTPTTSSTGTGSHSSGKNVYSSPNMPIPSSRLSAGDKTHVSSSGSSHRPLFSPTQTSSRTPGHISISAGVAEAHQPKAPTTYARAPVHHVAPTILSLAPGRIRSTSPLKASDPPLLPTSTPPDEEPEPVEYREPPRSTMKSTVQVVLPSRNAGTSKMVSPLKRRVERHHSPDPLDTNITRTVPKAHATPIASSSRLPSVPPQIASPSTSSARSRATPHPTGTQQSDRSDKSLAPARMSKRQLAQKEKEEAETAVRREARRIRKEKERQEKEREERSANPRERDSRRHHGEDESVVMLDGHVGRKSMSSRGRSTVTPSEVIVIEDETQTLEGATELASGLARAEQEPTTTVRKSADKGKKRKRVILDEDDADEDWGGSQHTVQPKANISPGGRTRPTTDVMEIEENDTTTDLAQPVLEVPIDDTSQHGNLEESVIVLSTDGAALGVAVEPSKKVGKTAAKAKKPKISAKAQAAANKAAKAKEIEAAALATAVEEDETEDEAVEEPIPVLPDLSADRATSPLSPAKSPSPLNNETPRPPLRPALTSVNSSTPGSSHRASPGPSNIAGGIKWKTSRSDLSSVLSKFGGARQSGMSRRGKIVSLHAKIGPPVKALPPPPPKPTRKKKGDSSEEEDSDEAEMESDGEGGVRKKKKVKGMEWYMMED